jgi:hypothetical protein
MIRRFSLLVVCGAVVVGCLSGSTASAQGLGGGGYGLGFYNYGGYGANGINQQRIPFYALHPPVYYSYPVPRPYGYSPFAYPPGVMTPEIVPNVGAAEFRNPFVPGSIESKPAVDRQAATGRIILNPFVDQARIASNLAASERVAE